VVILIKMQMVRNLYWILWILLLVKNKNFQTKKWQLFRLFGISQQFFLASHFTSMKNHLISLIITFPRKWCGNWIKFNCYCSWDEKNSRETNIISTTASCDSPEGRNCYKISFIIHPTRKKILRAYVRKKGGYKSC
jgi:hypothetical protein